MQMRREGKLAGVCLGLGAGPGALGRARCWVQTSFKKHDSVLKLIVVVVARLLEYTKTH